jgi:ribulose-5-phosphate 4-epimerase/fuculose-1-phosphate aldolase
MLGQPPEGLEELCEVCHLMYQSGLIYSAGGNASVRIGDHVYITATGGALGQIKPEQLVRVALDGTVVGPGKPSKELEMHLAMYTTSARTHGASSIRIRHTRLLFQRYPTPRLNAIPPMNAGFYMRGGQVPLIPYFHSVSRALHEAVAHLASDFYVILLGNHGLIAAGPTLLDALNVAEEVEQNCRMALLAGEGAQTLTAQQCTEIDQMRRRVWPDPAKYGVWLSSLPRAQVTV